MTEAPLRLGDLIDDYCPRCRLLLNHAVASFVGDQVAKVICQTCFSEHAYMHGEGGKKKKPPNARTTLFEQVLAKAAPAAPAPAPASQKKKSAEPARYISRHRTKPPRSGL